MFKLFNFPDVAIARMNTEYFMLGFTPAGKAFWHVYNENINILKNLGIAMASYIMLGPLINDKNFYLFTIYPYAMFFFHF